MVKRHRAALLPLAAALCTAFPAQAAWDFTPVLGGRLTWSDNIALRSGEQKESGWIREVSPGFTLVNETPRVSVHLDYMKRFYDYSEHKPDSAQKHTQDMSGALKAKVIEDLLFLDASADVHQRAVSPFGPVANGNSYNGLNSNEVRSYQISPYMTHRFGAFASGVLRFSHDSVDSDNIGMRRSTGNTVSVQLASGPSFRRFAWDGVLSRNVVDEQLASSGNANSRGNDQTTSSRNANLNLRYVASPQLNVGVFGGYDDYDFQGLGGAQKGAAYGANLQWTPSARTSLQASGGHRFYGPSYSLQLQHRSRSTVWNVNYQDAVNTSRSQFLLPSAIDTAAMLDNLFRAQISDPVLRAAAVQAYIKAANLPPALANNINFFSNRYSLNKQLNASVAWQLVRTTTTFSVYKTRREALSVQTMDSPLLGNNQSLFNDNIEQMGASLTTSYRIGPQTIANLSGSAYNNKSLTDTRSSRQRDARFSLSRSFGKRVAATLELRHVNGSRGLGMENYTENAVVAALTSKF